MNTRQVHLELDRMPLKRIKSLDSLRGVAALLVVFHHLLLIPAQSWAAYWRYGVTSDPWTWLYNTPLNLLVAGPSAVLVFFVLSGLVLALSFATTDKWHFWPYFVKRFTRIWLPFAAAIILSAGLQWVIGGSGPSYSSAWFSGSWNVAPSIAVIAQHLDLTQLWGRGGELDNPMWSLVYEARISLVFPLIAALVFFKPKVGAAATISIFIISFVLIAGRHRAIITVLAQTGVYAVLFFAGAFIARQITEVRTVVSRTTSLERALAWALALLIVACAKPRTLDAYSIVNCLMFSAACVGAIMIVALSTTETAITRLLERSEPSWLGKVSYSLYLTHLPVILVIFHLFPRAPFLLNCGISIVAALVFSEIFHRIVEVPSMWIGRRLSQFGI